MSKQEIENTPKFRDIMQYVLNVEYLCFFYGKEKALKMIQDSEKEGEKLK